jgi:single-strand DNA-binding protein
MESKPCTNHAAIGPELPIPAANINLGQAPGESLRYAQTGTAMLPFTLAINRRPAKDGSSQTDWIDCIAFGVTAENMATYLEKGSLVGVEGRIQTRRYETQDGQKRKAVEIVANTVHFLGKKQGGQDNNQVKAAADNWADIGREIVIADDEICY